MKPEIRNIVCCLWCGIRVGAVKSAFCTRDAKRLGIKLINQKHRVHHFLPQRQILNFYGRSLMDSILGGGDE